MSAYNIYYNNIPNVKYNIDDLIICMANKDLLKRKMGIGEGVENKDINLFLYLYDFLNDRICDTDVENDCFLDKINSLCYKYK